MDLTLCVDSHYVRFKVPIITRDGLAADHASPHGCKLSCSRERPLFDAIIDQVKPKACPRSVSVLVDEKGYVYTDAYGSTLTYCTAGELAEVFTRAVVPWNRAIESLLRSIPSETIVVLYWC